MKKLLFIITLFTIVGVLSTTPSCTKNDNNNDTLVYEMQTLQQVYNGCNIDSSDCTYITYQYPFFSGGSEIDDSLNHIVLTIFGVTKKDDLTKTQQTFIHEYSEFVRKEPAYKFGWFSQTNVNVPYQTKNTVSLSIETDDYTGGAHGIYSTFYTNFDKKSLRVITKSKLFTDSALQVLTTLAEEQFRKINEISATADLEEQGYTFNNNKFYLNDNFILTPEGITWLYNPYEIASYAQGAIELALNKEDILPLLNEEFKHIWD